MSQRKYPLRIPCDPGQAESSDPGEALPGAGRQAEAVAAQVKLPSRQLLAFEFSADAAFQGQFVGALERLESGGALRILDVAFVAADETTGELVAIALQGGTGGLTTKLLDFRLDPAARRRATERALASDEGGDTAQLLRDLGTTLQPGAAVAAVLVEHVWSRALEDAVSRLGGRPLNSEFVEATKLSELGSRRR